MQHYYGETQFFHDFACLSKKVFPYFHLPNLTSMHLTDGLNPEIHLPGCLEIVFSFPTPVVYYRERGTDTELIVSTWFSSYLVTRPLSVGLPALFFPYSTSSSLVIDSSSQHINQKTVL
ncbi:unnamed protein product [Rangifer tarandus platyrhynchus]|uniref:Uncharacterized protein n=1 Tax=Rangifer tarandus platyrhynchus TaxID=3082113 RepID=A0AC59ZCT9_RANTA